MLIPILLQTFRTRLPLPYLVVLLLTAVQPLFAQQTPVLTAKIERSILSVGNNVDVSYILRDASGTAFRAPQFKGCRVVSVDGPIRGGGFNNGRPYYQESWVYTLEATTPGNYSIAPATVEVNGKQLNSNTLPLKIKAVRVAASAIFLVGEFEHDTVFVGQQIAWRLKVCTSIDVQGDSELAMPNFEGFTAKEKKRFDTRSQSETIRNKTYTVQTLYEAGLYPQKEGLSTVDSATRRIGVVQQQRGLPPVPVQTVLQAPPAQLWVKPLPMPAPEGFAGLIGRYTWQVQVDRDSLRVGEALIMSIHLEGTGNPQRFAAPTLTLPPGFETATPQVRDEDVYENDQATFIHAQTLDYLILPKQAGQFTLHPQIVFFNTDSSRYDTLRLEKPFPITVLPGAAFLPDAGNSSSSAYFERSLTWLQLPIVWGSLALLVLSLVLLLWWKKRPKTAKTSFVSEPTPMLPLNDRFFAASQLLQTGPPRAYYDTLFKAFKEYLAVRLDLSPTVLTPTTMRQRMAERRVPFNQIQSALTIWQTCEQAVFAGQNQSASMNNTWAETNKLVKDLDALLGDKI